LKYNIAATAPKRSANGLWRPLAPLDGAEVAEAVVEDREALAELDALAEAEELADADADADADEADAEADEAEALADEPEAEADAEALDTPVPPAAAICLE